MSFLRDLLGEIGVPKVEKKLTGIEEIARTWGRPEPPRRHPHPFAPQVPVEKVDPDEVWEAHRKRKEVYMDVRDYDAILRAHTRIPEDLRPLPGRRK